MALLIKTPDINNMKLSFKAWNNEYWGENICIIAKLLSYFEWCICKVQLYFINTTLTIYNVQFYGKNWASIKNLFSHSL